MLVVVASAAESELAVTWTEWLLVAPAACYVAATCGYAARGEWGFALAYLAYATADGKQLVLAGYLQHVGGDYERLGAGHHVTYTGPPWSETKAGSWWKHALGKGVKIYKSIKGGVYVVKGGRFRITDWMRG